MGGSGQDVLVDTLHGSHRHQQLNVWIGHRHKCLLKCPQCKMCLNTGKLPHIVKNSPRTTEWRPGNMGLYSDEIICTTVSAVGGWNSRVKTLLPKCVQYALTQTQNDPKWKLNKHEGEGELSWQPAGWSRPLVPSVVQLRNRNTTAPSSGRFLHVQRFIRLLCLQTSVLTTAASSQEGRRKLGNSSFKIKQLFPAFMFNARQKVHFFYHVSHFSP